MSADPSFASFVMIVVLVLFGAGLMYVLGRGAFRLVRRAVGALPSPSEYGDRLRLAAGLLEGTVVLERSTVGGHVCWNRGGYPYYYYEKTRGEEAWSVISVGIRDKLLPTMQLRPREGSVPPLPPLLLRPPRNLAAEFDGRFEVRVPLGAPETLTPSAEVCSRILELSDRCFPHHPVLEIHETRVRLYLPTLLDTGPKRMRFLDQGATLLEAILREYVSGEIAAGVQVLDVLQLQDGTEKEETCMVCGERLGPERVQCVRCRTPHHRDCWEYAGMCAVFGCGSKRFA